MDETGQPGDSVPGGNGTGERGEATRLASWALAPAQPTVPAQPSAPAQPSSYPAQPPHPVRSSHPVNGQAYAARSYVAPEQPWSSAGAAMEPAMDPLSASWRAPVEYADAATPLAPGMTVASGLPPAPPYPHPAAVFPASAPPASAPPYPYEGDLENTGGFAVPERFTDRFGDLTPPSGMPAVPPPPPGFEPSSGEPAPPEPGTQAFPATAESAASDLPQRVPAPPDVPPLPEPIAEEVDPRAEVPELARIATYLRDDALAEPGPPPAPDAFDVQAVLAAVREVAGVRGAELRTNPGGVHTLRLDLADGADPGQVSRAVARLLNERMGLAAKPNGGLGPDGTGRAGLGAATAARAYGSAAVNPQSYVERGRGRLARDGEPTVPLPGDSGGSAGSRLVEAPPRGTETAYQARRRHPVTSVRGRAQPEPVPSPVLTERPSRPLPPGRADALRIVLDHVQVSTFGLDATVEVRLGLGHRRTRGEASGPAVDGYVLRLAAVSAAAALDELLVDEVTQISRGRCFVEHAAVLPFGSCEVAVVVVLLVCGGWVEQLAGSALVSGDPRQAVVRATLAAVNRRLESLLAPQ